MRCIQILLFLQLLWINSGISSPISASRIPRILLIGHPTKSNTGAILLLLGGTWKSVCRKGNDRLDQTWSTKEANVACRQLGYQGGWATELEYNPMANIRDVSLQLVDDFRCTGDERSLDKCYYDSHYYQGAKGCGSNNFAGVQCYDSFQVRLVGGTKPSVGRVQIRYDNNEWTNVCYDSKRKGRPSSPTWGFHEVQVVCRTLGYPGALMKQRGGYGNAEGQASVHGFNCLGKENHLTDCLSNLPEKSKRRQKYSCGARNEAVAICADPGYTGCFYYTDFHAGDKILLDRIESHEMTVRKCREHCRLKQSYRFAALNEGNVCMCGTKTLTTDLKLSPDSKCRDPCAGNDQEICGGYNFISLYDVEIGTCFDPYNKSNVYYFGDVVNAGQCPNAGYKKVSESPEVQCIMGGTWNETQWSGLFPHCTVNVVEDVTTSFFTVTALLVAIGCVCVLAALFITAVECSLGRICHRNTSTKVLKSSNPFVVELPTKKQSRSSNPLSSQLRSIRNSIRDSMSEHFYETTIRPRSPFMFNFWSTKMKYDRAPPQEDTYRMLRDPPPVPVTSVKYYRPRDLPQEDSYELSRDSLLTSGFKFGSIPTEDRLKALNPSNLVQDTRRVQSHCGSSRYKDNPQKALFRTSDDDVAAYIVRTKL